MLFQKIEHPFIIGIIIGTSGTYAIVRDKIKKVATKENAEIIIDETKKFSDKIKNVLNED